MNVNVVVVGMTHRTAIREDMLLIERVGKIASLNINLRKSHIFTLLVNDKQEDPGYSQFDSSERICDLVRLDLTQLNASTRSLPPIMAD